MKEYKKSFYTKMIMSLVMITTMTFLVSINVKAKQTFNNSDEINKQLEGKSGKINFTNLNGTIYVKSPIQIKKNQKVTIKGNATFVRDTGYTGPFFEVANEGKLILGTRRGSVLKNNNCLTFDGKKQKAKKSCLVSIQKGGYCLIGQEAVIQNFQTSQHGNIVMNNGELYFETTKVNGANNGHDDIYQNGEMYFQFTHGKENEINPISVNWRLYITKPRTTVIYYNMYVTGSITLDVSDNIKANDLLVKAMFGSLEDEKTTDFATYYTKNQNNVFKKGKGFLSIDYMEYSDLGVYLKSKVSLKDKTTTYNGKPIVANMPSIPSCKELSDNVKYTYYTDPAYLKKTTKANGSKKIGGAPKNVGTYYVIASIKDKQKKIWWKRGCAQLVINKLNGKITVNKSDVTVVEKKKTKITITKIVGNMPYEISSSNTGVVKVRKSKNKIVCQAGKSGVSTITITTKGNNNITPCTKKIIVKVAPEQIKIKQAKSLGKGKMVVRWKVSKTATGYDFQYARDSKFKEDVRNISVLCSKAKKGKGSAKNLTEKVTYYVRIRAYYMIPNGEKVAGPWSKTKKVTIK